MEISYYPGCTLKTKGKGFEAAAVASMTALGVQLKELPRWNCCGASYSLPDDDLIHQVAPVRNLVRAKEQGGGKLLTLCAFCYNTLKRANQIVCSDPEKKKTLNDFMDEEIDYGGEVETVHLLEVLRDDIGWEAVAAKVTNPLKGLRVAAYYGCTLLRPREIAIDDAERPTVLQDLLEALGAEVVDFPFATECCGSFQSVSSPAAADACAWSILDSARRLEADALVLTCPLCEYNLGGRQPQIMQQQPDFKGLPTLYFTQMLALALGLGPESCRLDLGFTDARPLLQRKKLIC